MYFDPCRLHNADSTDFSHILNFIQMSRALGYEEAGYNHTVAGPALNHTNQLPSFIPPTLIII